MIFWVVDWLTALGIHVPAVFLYSSTRMVLAAVTSLLFCILLGPRFIKKLYELKIGQPIRMEECPLLGELHKTKQDTPTMGGLLMIGSMVLSLLLWMDWTSSNTLILLAATLWLGGVGAYDDCLKLRHRSSAGLSMRRKFLLQSLFALLLGLYLLWPVLSEAVHVGQWFAPTTAREWVKVPEEPPQVLSLGDYMRYLFLPFRKSPWLYFSGFGTLLYLLLVVCVVTGSSNAVNLTDGLDGLAAGALFMVAACLGAIAFLSNHAQIADYLRIFYLSGSSEIAVYMAAFSGACLGFLWYNGHPAQVFMGDTGSLALGGILGVTAVLLKRELLLAVLGGLFVAEALSVILQVASYRLRGGKRILRCAPLHHHFEYGGWPETKVVMRFWIVGLLLAIVGIASLKFQ